MLTLYIATDRPHGKRILIFLFVLPLPSGYQSLVELSFWMQSECINCMFYNQLLVSNGKHLVYSRYGTEIPLQKAAYKFNSSHIWKINLIQSKKTPKLDKHNEFKFIE